MKMEGKVASLSDMLASTCVILSLYASMIGLHLERGGHNEEDGREDLSD